MDCRTYGREEYENNVMEGMKSMKTKRLRILFIGNSHTYYNDMPSMVKRRFDEEGCDCSHIVFEHSGWQPKVTSGVLREDCLAVLDDYFRPLVEQKS